MDSYELVLDEAGRIALPAELRERLGWGQGAVVTARVEGPTLRLSRHTAQSVATDSSREPRDTSASATLRDQARQLADAMRGLADTKEVRNVLSSLGLTSPRPEAAASPRKEERRSTTDERRTSERGDEESVGERAAAGGRVRRPSLDAPAVEVAPGVRAFEGHRPSIADTCYVDPAATVIGEVRLADWCSVWPGAVLRGDSGAIEVGERTNVQDGVVMHAHPGRAGTRVGRGVTIGHGAVLHSCTVADHVLIGMHAVVLDDATIGEGAIVGAGAVVPPGMKVPPGQLALGVPARLARPVTAEEMETIRWHADGYVELQSRYRGVLPPASSTVPLPTYRCRRAVGPIVVDGSLDENAWSRAKPVHLVLSGDGGPPRQATEARLCWDDRCLYVAFSCKDSDVWGTYTRRDEPLYDQEVVEIFLCPTGDLRHYFEFEISPLNTLFDAKVFSPEGDRHSMLLDVEWDAAQIQAAVRVAGTLHDRDDVDLGWIAEMALPFADLGLSGPPSLGDRWRMNLYRIERGEVEEYSAWSPTLKIPADFHVPARFGTVEFAAE